MHLHTPDAVRYTVAPPRISCHGLLLLLARHANLSAGNVCYRSSAVIQKIPEPELGRDLWREYRRWVASLHIVGLHTVQERPQEHRMMQNSTDTPLLAPAHRGVLLMAL